MPFISDDFLLQSDSASCLYHEYAKDQPIIDYHCHLPPKEVAEDKRWENLAQVWLYGDHYKWRAMRANGVDESLCTGDGSDREKFDAFAGCMPWLLRNPLYHWTQLELSRFFGIDDLLAPGTADSIWERANDVLNGGMSARTCMKQWDVEVVCTTDDPVHDLRSHRSVAEEDDVDFQLRPTWRPDKVFAVEDLDGYGDYLDLLEEASDVAITDLDELMVALRKRHAFFHNAGCRLSDYGLSTIPYTVCGDVRAKAIFDKARAKQDLSDDEVEAFQSYMLLELARMDARRGWTRQLHIGPLRNNRTALYSRRGTDVGLDSMGDASFAYPLSRHLDALDVEGCLGKTICYNLNPKDNMMLACMMGNFQDGETAGKMQWGSGWWFLDQLDGMTMQIETLSQVGLLSRFVGMLTDSRSFLSYARHEYFRRLLCNILGNDMEKGLLPDDFDLVGKMVGNICYGNAKAYFGFEE